MIEIISAIKAWIQVWATDYIDRSPDNLVQSWGFSELVFRDATAKQKTSTQPIPMTINCSGDRQQISLDDKFKVISWIRWTSPEFNTKNEEDQWGLDDGRRKILPLRILVAHTVDLGENLIHELATDLPPLFYLTGFDFVFLEDWSIDPDHEGIYRTELGDTVYEKHRFPWNVYAINLNVEYKEGNFCIETSGGVPDNALKGENGEPLLTEGGNYILV